MTERLWRKVQATRVTQGRRAKSDRLLARLGVLRCETCNARMTVATGGNAGNGGKYYTYRCPPNNDCTCKVSIMAEPVEQLLREAVAKAIVGLEGRSSGLVGPAQAAYDQAEARLAKARRIALLADDEAEAAEEIKRHREARDEAKARLEDARAAASSSWRISSEFKTGDDGSLIELPDFEGMGRDELRDLIATVVESATVRKAKRGTPIAERVTVNLAEGFAEAVQPALDAAAADLGEFIASRKPDAATVAYADKLAAEGKLIEAARVA